VEVVASLSQGRTAAAQCGLFTHKSVPVIFEPPCIYTLVGRIYHNESSLHGHESFKIAVVMLAYVVSTASVSSSVCVCVCVCMCVW